MTHTTELERLMAEATPGPWEYASDKLAAGNIKAMWNARLIVAAVNALPELLALRKENERLRDLAPRLILTGLQAGRRASKGSASLMWAGALVSDADWSREAALAALSQEAGS